MTHLFGFRIICGQNDAKNKSLLAHFSMAMNMPNSARAVIITFFLCILYSSNPLQAAEIQWHNLKIRLSQSVFLNRQMIGRYIKNL